MEVKGVVVKAKVMLRYCGWPYLPHGIDNRCPYGLQCNLLVRGARV